LPCLDGEPSVEAGRWKLGTHPAFCHLTIKLHALPRSADTCAQRYSSVKGRAFLRTEIIARLMRSVQPVLGPGVSEPLERTSSVCSCRQKFRDSVSPPRARGQRREARGELRCQAGLLSSSARNGRNLLLSLSRGPYTVERSPSGTG
jgi:hypothetical protein